MGLYQNRVVPHLVNLAMRNRELAPYRERTMALAEGRVLEIGVGSGLNLPFYTDRATEILVSIPPEASPHRSSPDWPRPIKTDRGIGGINSLGRRERRCCSDNLDAVQRYRRCGSAC
jgi:hypothetical protein